MSMIETFASKLTGVGYIIDAFPGADFGAKVMAASAALYADKGDNGGTLISAGGDYSQSTQIVLAGKRQKLLLGDGVYDNTITTFCPILLKDGCSVVAASKWGAQVYETINRIPQGDITSVIQDEISVADNTIPGNVDLLVDGIKFLPKAATLDAISGTVLFGNTTNVKVVNCCYFQTSAFCMSAGGSPVAGNFARNVDFRENVMIEAGTQNIAGVNCKEVFIVDNYMLSGGGGGRGASTFIDLECNTGLDSMLDFIVSRNIIDARGGFPSSPGAGIKVSGGDPPLAPNGLVVDNIIMAGPDGGGQRYVSTGLTISICRNVTISRNIVVGAGQSGITVGLCTDATIEHNKLVDCTGPTDDYQTTIFLLYTQDSVVRFNTLVNQSGETNHEQGITESALTDSGAACDRNLFYGNRMIHTDDGTLHEAKIILSGPSSRAWDNTFNNETFDGPAGVSTCAALTASPAPGTRHANNPPLAMVNGYLAVGDWRPRWFVFDFASTATHNGITICKPHNLSGGTPGRWIMVPDDPFLTTTARDAITWVTGDKSFRIFNTSVGKTQEWDGAAWNNLW